MPRESPILSGKPNPKITKPVFIDSMKRFGKHQAKNGFRIIFVFLCSTFFLSVCLFLVN